MSPLLTDAEIGAVFFQLDAPTKWVNEIQAYARDAAINHARCGTISTLRQFDSVKERQEAVLAENSDKRNL